MRLPLAIGFIVFAGLALPATSHAELKIDAYLSAPDEQAAPTSYTNTTVEKFDSLATGTITGSYVSTIGTYTVPTGASMRISADNDFGNGTDNYVAMGEGTSTKPSVTLQLGAQAHYFGFAYCAGDKNNGVSFYSGDMFIGRFSTATLVNLLSNETVTAVNNTVYQSSSYFGKPNTASTNTREPYAFVNFFATGGTFDRVVFDNTFSDTAFTGFESDNHTVSTSSQTAEGSFVRLATVVIPETSTATLLGLALPMIGGVVVVRRRKLIK